jgi:tetratricopeptide (TPR) repeat protein
LWRKGAGLAAREEIRRHIELARLDADSLFLLNLLFRDGRVLSALNRPLDAEPVLHEGLRLAEALNEPFLYRACLNWVCYAHINRGRLQDVSACYDRLLRLSQDSEDRFHEGYAWMGLAYFDWKSGMASDAREKYTRSVNIFRELGNMHGELWALVGLNIALSTLGAYEEAIAGNRRIIDMGRDNGSPEIEALGHNNLGVLLYNLGDNSEAVACFQRAAELQEQNGYVREAIIAGQNVCTCEIALGRSLEASRRLGELLETSREHGYIDVEVGLLKELAYAHLQQGEHRTAARMFREALDMPDGLTPKHECEIITGLSEAMAGMDSTDAALRLLRSNAPRMLDAEDARIQFTFRNEMAERLLDGNLPDEAFEMAIFVENRGARLGLNRYRLKALPLAARASLALGEPDSAFALLRLGVELWEADRGLPLDPEWREQRGALARELFTQLTWLIVHHPPGRAREERVREAFDVLQAYKARTLLERMLGPGGREVPVLEAVPVTLAELETRILAPDELLLDFVIGSDHSLLFACTSDESRALVIPCEAELNRKLRLFYDLLAARPLGPFASADREAIAATARNLFDMLFSSCADMIAGAEHLIVVPDGVLNLLPISILFRGDGPDSIGGEAGGPSSGVSSNRPDAGLSVSRIPSATILAWLRKRGKGDGDGKGPSGRILALAGRSTDRGETLTGAGEEVEILARSYSGVATQMEPGAALAGFDILHLATHSVANDQSPWRSAIYLDMDTERAGWSVLRASEIAGWRLPARLVVLSSCESAGGRILSGEGVQGLTSAFLSAGVPAVLATLWPVDDQVTVDFMTAFYEELNKGESVSVSVGMAQDALKRRSRTAHPFYWAGFVLTGEGGLNVDLRTNPRKWLPLWWVVVMVPFIVWLAVKYGRRKTFESQ